MEKQFEAAAWLESSSGEKTSILGTCMIGRSATGQLVLPDDKVSRRHAMIHAQGNNEYWLVDLGSSNGTYVNGRRVGQPCQLSDNDRIGIGNFSFVFRHPKREKAGELSPEGAEKTIQEISSIHCWLLLADIESSTQFARSLPAEEGPRVTGRWLAECKQVIDDHRGTINKFLGDGFFAYWAEREGPAAPAVVQALGALKAIQERAMPRFRIVIHYGKVFVGGAASLGEESLLGSEVNFVFRMEKLAGSKGISCLMSEPANQRLNTLVATRDEGRHPLPGFDGDFPFFRF